MYHLLGKVSSNIGNDFPGTFKSAANCINAMTSVMIGSL